MALVSLLPTSSWTWLRRKALQQQQQQHQQ
jgi:hypothetical protein